MGDYVRDARVAMVGCIASIVLVGTGCGASFVLKGPMTDKCKEAELEDCDELVDGALLYVDGKKSEAEEKLESAVAENTPDKVTEYVNAIDTLTSLPGIESYVRPVRKVIDILKKAAKKAKKGKPASEVAKRGDEQDDTKSNPATARAALYDSSVRPQPSAQAATAAPQNGADPSRMRTRTVTPVTDTRGATCEGSPAVAKTSSCARVPMFFGPFVVTDLYSAGGCADELFVSAEGDEPSRWAVVTQGASGFAMHGARLVVAANARLFVGARSDKGPLRNEAFRCSVTFSGWRPQGADE